MAKAKEIALTTEQNFQLSAWQNEKTNLTIAKENEFGLRIAIIKDIFDPTKFEGSETVAIGNGWKLKVYKRQDYSAGKDNTKVTELLAFVADHVDVGLAQELVRWQAELSVTAYKKLLSELNKLESTDSEKHLKLKELLGLTITIIPGAPSLELVPPEEKKAEQNGGEGATQ